ncbi:hypothetical protein SVIOM74S_07192 [Streptomyces violarus]
MPNIADTLYDWCREARPFALATVVQVSGSAPLPPGTALAVNADGTGSMRPSARAVPEQPRWGVEICTRNVPSSE